MSNIFFISDTHFGHNKEFLYCPRGFSNVKEMGEQIVKNWNEKVNPEDTVYHLGDIIFGTPGTIDFNMSIELIKQLNGNIILIRGNHDSDAKIKELFNTKCITCCEWADMLTINKQKIYLAHYPTLTANFDDKAFSKHVIALHGHTHQTSNFLYADNPFLYHVGVDSHNCAPVHIDEILTDIHNRWIGITQLKPAFNELYFIPQQKELNDLFNKLHIHKETCFA